MEAGKKETFLGQRRGEKELFVEFKAKLLGLWLHDNSQAAAAKSRASHVAFKKQLHICGLETS